MLRLLTLKGEGKADIAIIDIQNLFLSMKRINISVCKEKFVSIAVIEDESDYDAFKNFGIDAWIKYSDISQINNLNKPSK